MPRTIGQSSCYRGESIYDELGIWLDLEYPCPSDWVWTGSNLPFKAGPYKSTEGLISNKSNNGHAELAGAHAIAPFQLDLTNDVVAEFTNVMVGPHARS
jgi:hypothetical protein